MTAHTQEVTPVSDEQKTDEQSKVESTETPNDEQPKDDSQQEAPADEQPEDESKEGSEEEAPKEEDGEDVPAPVLREKLTKANNEAASYRKKLREAEDKLKNAKSPEEVDEIVQQMTKDREAAETALLRENVALKHKLPESLMKRLTGTTREELEADAKELADLFGTDDGDEELVLEGGLSPKARETEASDPRSLAQKHGARAKRR